MSRRFGRNQRRRMREELASERAARELDRELMRRIRKEREELRSQIAWAKKHLIHYSFALKPNLMRLAYPYSPIDREVLVEKSRRPGLATYDNAQYAVMFEENTPLPVLVLKLGLPATDRATDGMQHLRVRYQDRTYGYAITPEAWQMQGEDELVRHISEELAFQFVNEMRKYKDGDVF